MPPVHSPSKRPLALRQVFAQNVRLVRTNTALSQEALADEAELDRTFVSSVERGVRNISIDNIERIAHALRAKACDLLDPELAERTGLDTSLLRAPRTTRPVQALSRKPRKAAR